MEWIKVEDQLPEHGSLVIVYEPSLCTTYQATFHRDNTFGKSYRDPYFYGYNGRFVDVSSGKITHWVPWPKTPEENV